MERVPIYISSAQKRKTPDTSLSIYLLHNGLGVAAVIAVLFLSRALGT
jgi:hypothetical protein